MSGQSAAYTAELEILASQNDAHAAALQRYANDVETIQQQQTTITASETRVAGQLTAAKWRLRDAHIAADRDPTASPTAHYRLQGEIEDLTAQASGLRGQLALLAQQRSAADHRTH